MARGGVAERPKAAGLWRNRDWTQLWSGQLVSVVGTQVSQLAYPLLMLALTITFNREMRRAGKLTGIPVSEKAGG